MALDKLVDSSQLDTDLTSVANAIRAKSGGSSQLAFPSGFVSEIGNIPTGGGGEWTTEGIARDTEPNGAVTVTGTSIGDYAFAHKTGITSISCPNVVSVGTYAFKSCTGLTSLTLPAATSFGQCPFHGCSNITYLSCPSLKVSPRKFNPSNMTNLEQVNLPALVTMTSDQFMQGTKLTCVVLPKFGSEKINNYNGRFYGGDFKNNKLLQSIDVNYVQSILDQVFYGCTVLNTIILRGNNVPTLSNTNTFTGTPFASEGTGGTIYIPKSIYDHLGDGTSLDFQAVTNWSTVYGWGKTTFAKIEGSIYETQYADGTAIPTS